MAYDLSNISRGYLAGRQTALQEREAAQAEQFNGLKMEALVTDMAQKERQAAKAERIGILSQEAMTPDAEARQAAFKGLAAQGPEGLQAAQDISAVQKQQADQAMQMVRNNLHLTTNVPQNEIGPMVKKTAQFAQKAGLINEDTATQFNRLSNLDPVLAQRAAMRMAGFDPKDDQVTSKPTTFRNVDDPTKVKRLDLNNPEDLKQFEQLDAKWWPEPTRQETGGPGEFTKTQQGKIAMDLKEAEIATKNAIGTVNEAVNTLNKNPDAFTAAGSMARFASGMATEAEALARAAGVDIPKDVEDIEKYGDTFKALGVDNTEAQNALLDLSLAYATAIGLGSGRALSDKDIRLAMRRVGAGGMNTPEARKAAMESVKDILVRNFKTRYKVMTGKNYAGDLGGPVGKAGDIGKMDLQQLQTLNPSDMSDEELQAAAKRFKELQGGG